MNKTTIGFFEQTAIDYDIPMSTIKDIYDKSDSVYKFYENLEAHINKNINDENN